MGIAERKERQKTELRDRILDAAWQVVLETGWQSLSIRKIADAIEYSVPVVYEHFENKEAILLEFTKLGYRRLTNHLKQAKAGHRDPVQQLDAMVQAYWGFAFAHKEYYQVMFGLGMPTCVQVKIMPELNDFTGTIGATIERISKAADRDVNIQLKVQAFWSMLHGLVSINLVAPVSSQHDINKEDFNKLILKEFITGFISGLKS